MEIEPDEFDELNNVSVTDIVQSKISPNIRELNNFLATGNNGRSFITEKGDPATNIIHVSEKKTYNIQSPYIEDFFSRLDECRKEGRQLHYSEKQETKNVSHTGIMIDFDRYQKSRNPQITNRHLDLLCTSIARLLRETLDLKSLTQNGSFSFKMFIIRKPSVVVDSRVEATVPIYKDGFHVLIPEIQVTKGYKKYLLAEMCARKLITYVFRGVEHLEEAEKMLDKLSASNPVHFFGNSKPGKPPYILTHAYEFTIDPDYEEIEKSFITVDKLLQGIIEMREDIAPTETTREPERRDVNLTYELSLGFYFPEIIINNKSCPTWLKKVKINYNITLETKIQLSVEKNFQGIIPEEELDTVENSVDILTLGNAEAKYLKNLLSIIDISYASEYDKWFKVICAIAHCSTAYKILAVWFSQRVPNKWSPAEVDRIWNEALSNRNVRNPVTKRSLLYWAKESSPQRLAEINKENYVELLAKYVYQNEGRVEHAMVARIVYAMISDKFVVDVALNEKTNRTGYCWWEFVVPGQAMKHGEVYKWRKEVEPDNIHLFIAEHLPKIYSEQIQRIRDRKDACKDEIEGKYWVSVEKTFRQYMTKLSNDGFQTGIVKQAQYKFRCRGFADDLDEDEYLIGVGNGILKIGAEPKFIQGFHEYKVSKYTETDYVDRPFNPLRQEIAILLQWCKDIFPEHDMSPFMWMHASTGLDFCESACIILLLVGGGQNGKSSWAKMIHNTLGNQYCAAGKSALLTSPIERGESANSAQMQARGKRFMYFDEFNKSEEINPARLKSFVNPGWQSGRDLREKQTNFKNTTNPIALSNYDFTITTTDHGTWRRVYYYRNKIKFTKTPNPDNPYEKQADENFIRHYPDDPVMKTAMLEILTHHRAILERNYSGDIKNIPVPTIMKETEEFRNRQDALNRFITQMIVKSPANDPIPVVTIAVRYSEWYSRNIKQMNFAAGDILTQLENSQLSNALEYKTGGTKMLVGHRIKNAPEEIIQAGETELSQKTQVTGNTDSAAAENTIIKLPSNDPADNIEIKYLKDVTKNTPMHIQKTESNDLTMDLNNILLNL